MSVNFSEKVTIENLQVLLLHMKEYENTEINTIDFVHQLKESIMTICTSK